MPSCLNEDREDTKDGAVQLDAVFSYLQQMKKELSFQIAGIEQCLLNPSALPGRKASNDCVASQEGGASLDALLQQSRSLQWQDLSETKAQHNQAINGTKAKYDMLPVLIDLDTATDAAVATATAAAVPSTTEKLPVEETPIENAPKPSLGTLKKSNSIISMDQEEITSEVTMAKKNRIMHNRKKKRLQRIFEVNDMVQRREAVALSLLAEKKENHGLLGRLKALNTHELEMFIDSCMSGVIASRAVFIGLSIDYQQDEGVSSPWEIADISFSTVFFIELCVKLLIHGFREHFCGRDKFSNVFDASLIVLDGTQVLMSHLLSSFQASVDESGMPSASLFRVVRLIRLTRLIRLLRTEMFADLLSMIHGVMAGALTLFWAIVVFFMSVYVVALVCRESFGVRYVDDVYIYFQSVPRSMFTVFRCSFGDCSSQNGTPIPEFIAESYGGGFALLYCLFVFSMTIGLFNVVSAIFVDSTMANAARKALWKATQRLEDEERWATNVATIIKALLAETPENSHIDQDSMTSEVDKIVNIDFDRMVMEKLVRCDAVKMSLNALDIDPADHKMLWDILDPDHSGRISMLELVNGLQRLRGVPRRSDTVTVQLMMRALQEQVDEIHERVVDVHEKAVTRGSTLSLGNQEPS